MELELKHLAPYLPHQLKVKWGDRVVKMNTGQGSSKYWIGISSVLKWYNSNMIEKPNIILLPMSSLYTEMEDGKVPIVEIYKKMFIYPQINEYRIENCCLKFGKHTFEWVDEFRAFSLDGDTAYITIEASDYLDEKHFDWRYGLIDKGLALDKTKIK